MALTTKYYYEFESGQAFHRFTGSDNISGKYEIVLNYFVEPTTANQYGILSEANIVSIIFGSRLTGTSYLSTSQFIFTPGKYVTSHTTYPDGSLKNILSSIDTQVSLSYNDGANGLQSTYNISPNQISVIKIAIDTAINRCEIYINGQFVLNLNGLTSTVNAIEMLEISSSGFGYVVDVSMNTDNYTDPGDGGSGGGGTGEPAVGIFWKNLNKVSEVEL